MFSAQNGKVGDSKSETHMRMNVMKVFARRKLVRTFALTVACSLLALAGLGATDVTDIKVVTSGAFTAAFLQLAPKYENETHNKLHTEFGPSMGVTHNAIPVRLERGEAIDVVIMAAPALDDLIKQGKVRSDSRVDLVQSKMAMAVKAGAPHPDISNLEAFKRTLLAAKSIAYSDSASGVYLSTVLFPKLGIADQIKAKSKMIPADPVGGVVASGEFEIGFQQVSELRPVKGIDIVGELPPGAQQITVFAAGIPTTSTQPEAARTLIQWLAASALDDVIRKNRLGAGEIKASEIR